MMHSGKLMTGTLEYLRRPIIANVTVGMKVLVITDTAHDPRVWQAVMSILTELGADATLALFDPRPADYYDPPAAVCEAMKTVDLNKLIASTGMLHSHANSAAMDAGVPVLCMDGGMTLEMFQSGAVTENQKEMALRQYYVATNIFGKDAKTCRVTSKYGCDFTYSVEGRIFIPNPPGDDFVPYRIQNVSKVQNRKSNMLRFLYPNGEFNVPPVEGTGNGKLVVDLCMHQIGRLSSPIELTVVDGRITAIDGGADAHFLRNYLETYGDENAYMCPAEASIGINSKALVRGVQREDKNILGSIHFGLGTNVDVGGSVLSNIHMDGVLPEPTLYVDGDMRIEHGRFLRPIDRPL
jgi:2,5-dihydroxypyridine 5,6-dioxygenase